MKQARMVFGGPESRAELRDDGITFTLSTPALGGAAAFSWLLPDAKQTHEAENCLVHDCGHLLVGWLRGAAGESLETTTGELYEQMFRFVGERFLYRLWHFIPRINIWETDLENYRLFCLARADAFRRILGENCHTRMPAASTVGGALEAAPLMLFVAGTAEPRHLENPEQIPAYRYPPAYGPRAPSFARASRVAVEGGEVVFISGTASIKGFETVHPDDCEKQIAVTLHNLSLIGEASGLGPDLGRASGASRNFVVYLRRKEDLPLVEALLRDQLLGPADKKVFLLADICRAELMVEIEATVFLPPAAGRSG